MTEQDLNRKNCHSSEPKKKKYSYSTDGSSNFKYVMLQRIAPSPFLLLPDEVVEHILSFFDSKTLLNSALVNTRWNNIIGKSREIMQRFPLSVRLWESGNEELHALNRLYQTLEFKDYYVQIPENMNDALTKIGGNVGTFSYKGYYTNAGESNLQELLSCFSVVENIAVTDYKRFTKIDNKLNASVLANLKSLKLKDCNKIIQFFEGAQLVELEIDNCDSWNDIIDFLSSQTRLTKLKLSNFEDVFKLPTLKCQVRVLSLTRISGKFEKRRGFMNLFSSSVVDLTLRGSGRENLNLISVLSNFKLLLKLELRNFIGFYQHGKQIDSNLNTLKLRNIYFPNADALVGSFSLFSKVTHLHLHFESPIGPINSDNIRSVTEAMKDVQRLTFTGRFCNFQHFSFENLQSFELLDFDAGEEVNWTRLICNNPKLKTMHIQLKEHVGKFDFMNILEGIRNSMTVKISEKPKENAKSQQ